MSRSPQSEPLHRLRERSIRIAVIGLALQLFPWLVESCFNGALPHWFTSMRSVLQFAAVIVWMMACGLLAYSKCHNRWFFLAGLASIFGFVALLFLPDRAAKPAEPPADSDD